MLGLHCCTLSAHIAAGLSLGVTSGSYSLVVVHGPPAVVQVSAAVAQGLSSCSLWALELGLSIYAIYFLWLRELVAQCMWNLPQPGIKPASPALAGGCLTTGPPAKSYKLFFCLFLSKKINQCKNGRMPNSSSSYINSFAPADFSSVLEVAWNFGWVGVLSWQHSALMATLGHCTVLQEEGWAGVTAQDASPLRVP